MTDPTLGRHVGASRRRRDPAGAGRAPGPVQPPARAAHRSRTADLTGRVESLERALAVGGDRLRPAVRVRRDRRGRRGAGAARPRRRPHAGRVRRRHRVRQVEPVQRRSAGLPFADVGVRRPTTSEVTACVWGGDGRRAAGLARRRPGAPLPARDARSTATPRRTCGVWCCSTCPTTTRSTGAHRAVVDRLLPMVDLLVWVVDPQKYADDALHTGYLRGLVGQEAAMVVRRSTRWTPCPSDVARPRSSPTSRRLLAEDGLTGVPVLPTSVDDGDRHRPRCGRRSRSVVAGPSTAAVRAGGRGDGRGARLLPATSPPREPPARGPAGRGRRGRARARGGLPDDRRRRRRRPRAADGPPSPAARRASGPAPSTWRARRWLTGVGARPAAAVADARSRSASRPHPDLRRAVDRRAPRGPGRRTRRSGAAVSRCGVLGVLCAVAAIVLGAVVARAIGRRRAGADGRRVARPSGLPAPRPSPCSRSSLLAAGAVVRAGAPAARRADAVREAGRSALDGGRARRAGRADPRACSPSTGRCATSPEPPPQDAADPAVAGRACRPRPPRRAPSTR